MNGHLEPEGVLLVGDENKFGAEYRSFREPDYLSNVVLIVEGVKLYAHKEILASWSPYFLEACTSQRTPSEGKVKQVVIKGCKVDDIETLLNHIYPPNRREITTKDEALRILPLAEQFQMECLKDLCEKRLMLCSEMDLSMIEVARRYRLVKLLDRVKRFCSNLTLSSIDHVTNPVAAQLPPSDMAEIYRHKITRQANALGLISASAKSLALRLQRWEKTRGVQCTKHKMFDADCQMCLLAFKDQFYTLINEHKRSIEEYKRSF